MKIEKIVVQSCCNSKQLVFKIDRPIDQGLLDFLKTKGFNDFPHFTKSGLLYTDNANLIISGPFGANKLNIKCKKPDCDQFLNDFESLLAGL